MNNMRAERQADLGQPTDQVPEEVRISESDRLRFARQVVLGLAIMSSAIMAGFACYPDNKALAALTEIIKIGALPMATLVIAFYFSNGTRK